MPINFDILGETFNFRVALPDFFRGKPWEQNRIKPEDGPTVREWLGTVANWDNVRIKFWHIYLAYQTNTDLTCAFKPHSASLEISALSLLYTVTVEFLK
ncbi:hypothetical protein K7432_017963 [Basidiobolus ranarum]|uniref:Uncharacterized protein n=1 Tax=Basidiobolus ranarum TaxID=34480 RepID=A0ABR2WCR6_9FUNG